MIKIALFALSSAPGALESASKALERDLGDAENALVLHEVLAYRPHGTGVAQNALVLH